MPNASESHKNIKRRFEELENVTNQQKVTNYKEQILEAWANIKYYLARGVSVETSNFESLLNSLPSEKEIAKGRVKDYVKSHFDLDYSEAKVLKDCYDWLDKEQE